MWFMFCPGKQKLPFDMIAYTRRLTGTEALRFMVLPIPLLHILHSLAHRFIILANHQKQSADTLWSRKFYCQKFYNIIMKLSFANKNLSKDFQRIMTFIISWSLNFSSRIFKVEYIWFVQDKLMIMNKLICSYASKPCYIIFYRQVVIYFNLHDNGFCILFIS